MAYLRGRHAASLGVWLAFAAAVGCSGDGAPGGTSTAPVVESREARAVVDALRAWLPPAHAGLLAPSSGAIETRNEQVVPRFSARRGTRATTVALPVRAGGAFHLADVESGVTVAVTLAGARDVAAEVAGGLVVYRGAHPGGADVVHRPTEEGTEDFLSFQRAPEAPEVRYQILLGERVAGLRLVASTLELLGPDGAPRLRMAPPYVIDSRGVRHDASVAVEGCAYDTDPRAPWGRSMTAPGARQCAVRVAWGSADIGYPALLDPAWTSTGNMTAARNYHSAALLTGGNVLVAGGLGASGVVATAEIYSSTLGTWAVTGSMAAARSSHTATVLSGGNVLVAGGQGASASLASAEIYTTAGTWSPGGTMVAARAFHTASLLGNGMVLAAGGLSGSSLATAELYNPSSNTWSATGSLTSARYAHTATVLATTGNVLVAGGAGTLGYLASAELYSPTAGTWSSAGNMATPRDSHAASLLGTGLVLVSGGFNGSALAATETYNPTSNAWSPAASLSNARYLHTSTVLASGKVLVAGGTSGSTTLASAELFNPTSSAWSTTEPMVSARYGHTASLVGGSVLVAGGYLTSGPINGAELFALVANGGACAASGDCGSGFCVDGVCCVTACTGLCQACSPAKTVATNTNGTCMSIPAGTDPDNECTALPASTCQQDGFCNGAGACELYASGTTCVAPSCGNGTLTSPTCNGAGVCQPNLSSCAPYVCANATACATTCTSDTQCAPTYHCQAGGTCVLNLGAGSACTAATQCQSGNCVDGVCCDSACAGLCQACSAVKTGVADGTCAPVKAGSDPDAECTADPASTCQQNGFCDGAGACQLYAIATSCGAASTCTGTIFSGEVCDGLGHCGGNPNGTNCAPYVCHPSGCATPCTGDQDCVPGSFCSAGACVTQAPKGNPCTVGDQCQSGFCVEGLCCDSACNGVCQACTAANKASGADGACGDAKAGADPHKDCSQDTAESCKLDGTCDGNGACREYVAGTPCGTPVCVDNTPTALQCNGSGACLAAASAPSCGAFVCSGGTTCTTTCTVSADCAPGAWCNAGSCQIDTAQGKTCATAAECATGFCVDGVCCDSACTQQCEACDVPGGAGTCVPVDGAPHGARTACSAGTAESPCSAASCDGSNRATCIGFVGSEVMCRAGSCSVDVDAGADAGSEGVEVLPATCDGKGHCPDEIDVPCSPFACGDTQCKTSCADDVDCAPKYRCQDKLCVLGATCDGAHTVYTADGQIVDCGFYTCQGNGTCRTQCGSIDDCTEPNICLEDGQCGPPAGVTTFLRIQDRATSCAVSSSPASPPGAWLLVLAGAAIGALRRHRRRAGLAANVLRPVVALAAVAVTAASCSMHREGETLTTGPVPPNTTPRVEDSPAARKVVDTLRSRYASAVTNLSTTPADGIEHEGAELRPHLPEGGEAPVPHHVAVTLPERAAGAFRLTDATSGVAAEVTLEGASDAGAEVAGGFVVYRGGALGADIVHRPAADGTEDYLAFEDAPAVPELRYRVTLRDRVAGVRLVASTLELLDATGAPRLRMAPPYVVGADGSRHLASVSVSGCALDTDPRAPWGRPVTAPGAEGCMVRVSWDRAVIHYPALVDPAWTATGNMATARARHIAVVLAGGNVLVAGGATPAVTAAAELYNPGTGTWAATGSLATAREFHTAALLTSVAGNPVLVAGGFGAAALASAELYTPSSGMWSAAGSLTTARYEHASSALANGSVVVAGGTNGSVYLATAEVYSPASNTWTSAGTMTSLRAFHTMSLLASGQILAAGGINGTTDQTSTELYTPSTNTWAATGSMTGARERHSATVLGNGSVLVAGGTSGGTDVATAEVYTPSTAAWAPTGSMANPRHLHAASLVLGGKVLVAGGRTTASISAAELYTPAAGTWAAAASMETPRDSHTMSVLGSGQILAAGGYLSGTSGLVPQVGAELFAFGAAGATCGQPGDCASGFCVDGFCCSTACTAVCQACSVALTGGVNGTCSPITAGTNPHGDCTNQGANSCGQNGACNGAGACQLYAAGTSCGASSCTSGTQTTPICDGSGNCQPDPKSCSPYVCANATCGTTCTIDSQCVSTSYCRFSDNTCQPAQAVGAACTEAHQCASNNCVDGFCCNSPCGGLCQACSAAKTGSASGTCAPVTAGTDPDNECPADPVSTCQRDGQCNGAGACRLYANTVSCGTTTCSGNVVSGQICDGLGTCAVNTTGTNCTPYLCQAGSCTNPCVDSTQCAVGNYCSAGTCTPQSAQGGACTAAEQCLSGFCVEGVCCNTACNGICQACTAANQVGGTDGTCGDAKDGTDPHNDCADQGASSCQDDGLCDGNGACRKYPAGSTCAPTDCVDNAPVASTCNGAGTCLPDPNPQSCGDFLCTKGACDTTCTTSADCAATSWCNAGACQPRVAQGQPCTVDDGCTTGLCADGICCNAPCLGQCEACNVAGAEGTCLPVTGKPYGARTPCMPGTPGHPCLQEECDGVERTVCAGFVGASLVCRPASCVNGLNVVAVVCDGLGNCPALGPDNSKDCSPFACLGSGCKSSCTVDDDCSLGYRCQAPNCVPGECDGDHTVISGNKTIDCAPYKCTSGGACFSTCKSVDDCAAPNVCDETGACVAPNQGVDEQVSGCSTPAATNPPRAGWLSALWLAALVAARRRRRAASGAP